MTTNALEFLKKHFGPLTFGNMLCCIRKCDEISQTDFAKTLGISRQFLCDLEKDRRTVSPKKAKEFAEILGYSTQQFISLALQQQLKQNNIHMEVTLAPTKLKTKTSKTKVAHAH